MDCLLSWRWSLALALPLALVWAAPARPVGTDPVLRILVRAAPTIDLGAAATVLRLSDARGQVLYVLAPGQSLRLRSGARGVILERSSLTPGVPSGPLARDASRPAALATVAPVLAGELPEVWVDSAAPGGLVPLGAAQYRGRLRVVPLGDRLQVVNFIGLESYLPSVVGSEMPAQWPLAALRAQAIAARTYAMAQRRPGQLFDLQATVASQVYKGVGAETTSTRQAVAQTNGQVLLYRGRLIDAVFHSCSGGNTENSGEIWNRQLPYLTSVPDFDQVSPVRNWSKAFEPQELRRAFVEIDGVTAIEPLLTSTSGRIRQARVTGPGGQLVVSGAELRRRLGLRSTLVRFQPLAPAKPQAMAIAVALASDAVEPATAEPAPAPRPSPGFRFRLPPPPPPLPPVAGLSGSVQPATAPTLMAIGHGFGHGVGMSQWGAYGMALRGKSHAEILRHYYQGAELGLRSL
jgi:stage II sporulation protein D